jgi:hypothetical protein
MGFEEVTFQPKPLQQKFYMHVTFGLRSTKMAIYWFENANLANASLGSKN